MRRPIPRVFPASLSLVFFALSFGSTACSSSGEPDPSTADTGYVNDTTGLEDVGDFEEPVFDPDSAVGRVILLRPYDPVNRCFDPPTAVGHPDEGPGGGILPCGTIERCYKRKDGWVFYAEKDCVHGTNFLFNVQDDPYTDATDCEPIKHIELLIKDCPVSSCTYARDVLVDTARDCATAITSRACRSASNVPTGCFCDASRPNEAFVAFDGKTAAGVPAGFTPCDSTNPACAKALSKADTVQGCPPDAVPDAGSD